MKKISGIGFFTISYGILTSVLCHSVVSLGESSVGRRFAIGFPRNHVQAGGAAELSVSIANYEMSDVNVTVTASGGFNFIDTISSGSSTRTILPISLEVLSVNERSKGICVEATGNVNVHGLSYHSCSSDSYLALPCLILSVNEYEYFAISYDVSLGSSYPSVILVVACENATAVTIGSTTVMLSSMETYQISNGRTDLTGTRITSSKPVSVMSGADCANVPSGVTFCDHLVEHVPPTVTWGSEFFVSSLNGRNSNELIRVLSARNATVTVTCNTAVSVSMFQMTRGGYQTLEIPVNSFCSIESTGPVLVAQYAYGGSADDKAIVGDPFMMIIPPTQQYINKHIFQTYQSFHSDLNSHFTVYVTSEFYQSLDILINNAAISGWQPVPCSNEPACGYIARMTVSSGLYTIRHQNPSAIIGVSAYGFSMVNSYGMPVGMGLSPIQCKNIAEKFTCTVAPSISVPPVNVSVVSPDPTLLSCTADGVPSPSISWLRQLDNGTEVLLTTDSVLQIVTVLADDNRTVTSSLTFSETQPFRSGVYVCVAYNLLGSIRAMAQLTVKAPPRTTLIQLRLVGIDRCQQWVVEDGRQKLNTLSETLSLKC